MITDPVLIALFSAIGGAAFSLIVFRSLFIQRKNMKSSVRLAMITTMVCALVAYLIIVLLRWLL